MAGQTEELTDKRVKQFRRQTGEGGDHVSKGRNIGENGSHKESVFCEMVEDTIKGSGGNIEMFT